MATKLVIVGGVAGGATAAARARRVDEKAEIVMFERGEYVSFANCGLPYYIGGDIKKRDDLLVATPQYLEARFRIKVRTMSEVTTIDRTAKAIVVKDLRSGEIFRERYDKLILSPGAEPVRPPLEGIDLPGIYSLRNIPDTDRIKAVVDEKNPQHVVIVGGGFIGIEMAEALRQRGIGVTVVEMLDQVLAPLDFEMAALIHMHLIEKGVRLRLGEAVKSFRQNGEALVVAASGGDINADMVLLSIGVKPENKLAKECGLEIGERGGIVVDETMRTSDADIFAVGDAVQTKDLVSGGPAQIPLAGPANKQARIAADNALGRKATYNGVQGTAVVKVFDFTASSTGLNEKTLKRMGRNYLASITHSMSHAGYYPGAEMLSMKITFDPEDGKLLGAQTVGKFDDAKRIDVLATAIRGGMTVYDLEELELAYAPPYGSAKDPVNMAGFTAANILKGDCGVAHWNEAEKLEAEGWTLLDLRTKGEVDSTDMITDDSIHIPLHDLRDRMGELKEGGKYVLYCGSGLRSYVGCRILAQNGFEVKNLSGGVKTYFTATMK